MRVRGLLVALMSLAVWVLMPGVSVAAADSCPNAVYRTGPSANLPDCRAYEQVSPPFKAGGVVLDAFTNNLSAGDGSNMFLDSLGGFGEPLDNAGPQGSDYTAVRTASGWVSRSIDPPQSQFQISGLTADDVSQDFSRSLFRRSPRSSKPFDYRFYRREPDGSFVELGLTVPPAAVAAWVPADLSPPNPASYEGGSVDLSRVLFSEQAVSHSTIDFLWPGDGTVGGSSSLYEYSGSGNSSPRLVGVDEEGHQISQCGTSLGANHEGGPVQAQAAFNAVSPNGNIVFFSVAPGGCTGEREGVGVVGSGPPVAEVYARVNGAATVAISEPSPADCSACDTAPADQAPAVFQGASQDGAKAFFLTSQPLLGGDSTSNLYLYDFAAPAGQRVVRMSAGDPAGANVKGVVRISEDGARVYFVAGGVLTSVPNGQGQSAVEGEDNLYLYEPDPAHPGQSKTVFVTALSGGDAGDWALTDRRPVEVTPDGRFLLFLSNNRLTPDCATCAGRQLYRYDAQSGELVRVSIGQDGFNQNGVTLESLSIVSPIYSNDTLAAPRLVSISNDGAYVFFKSATGLTPQALNNVCLHEEEGECYAYAQNIYEYHEGQVHLISDGQDRNAVLANSAVQLLGASPSGADVYFRTADPLVAQDTDTQADVYDARIDGGFPAPAAAASCQGEACQGGLSTTPLGQVPGSFAFTGPGDSAPSKVSAKKTTKKRHVKKKAKKPRRKKRHAKAPHSAGKGR